MSHLHSSRFPRFGLQTASGRDTPSTRHQRYRPRLESLEDRTLPALFFVTSMNDSGPGTLRAAILSVNADPNPNLDVIDFHLPPTAPPIINLKSALPTITHQVFVDGTSQPGFMGTPLVEVNGAAVPGVAGLVIKAAGAPNGFTGAIRALKIDNCAIGIRIVDTGSNIPAKIVLDNNSIMSTPGGSGIIFLAGINATQGQITNNSITTVGMGVGIAALTAGTTDKLAFAGNTIHASGGGDGIRVQGGADSNFFSFSSNHVTVQTGGDGIAVTTGPNATSVAFVSNVIMTFGGGDCVTTNSVGKSTTFFFMSNLVMASGGGDGIRAAGNALTNDLTFASNKVFANSSGDALIVALSTSSKTIARVVNNTLNTSTLGIGLGLLGGATFQAFVQSNDFHNNRVGVSVRGNGVTAGNVDLGGGTLGSTGGNDFKSFLSSNATSYAIGLFNVASVYTMHAMMNLFSVPPATVIADGSHDLPAGGSGSILT